MRWVGGISRSRARSYCSRAVRMKTKRNRSRADPNLRAPKCESDFASLLSKKRLCLTSLSKKRLYLTFIYLLLSFLSFFSFPQKITIPNYTSNKKETTFPNTSKGRKELNSHLIDKLLFPGAHGRLVLIALGPGSHAKPFHRPSLSLTPHP